MNETDVTALSAAALATVIDPDVERAWATAARVEFCSHEQRLMAEFRMWRFVRDDTRMQGIEKELARVRGCLTYLDGVLAEGGQA